MLRSLLAYTRGAGVDTRWLVLDGTPEFFAVTKRLHNRLHAAPGERPPLGEAERAAYEAVDRAGGAPSSRRWSAPATSCILHDPQTPGMAPGLRERRRRAVVWRAHVGVDAPDDRARAAWDFLRPYVARRRRVRVLARALRLGRARRRSASRSSRRRSTSSRPKNQELDRRRVAGDPARGRASSPTAHGPPDCSCARTARRAAWIAAPTLVQERAAARRRPLRDAGLAVGPAQGPGGRAARASCSTSAQECGAQLVLVGPDVAGVSDDPEGAEVLEEVIAAWRALPAPVRGRVHLRDAADEGRRGERARWSTRSSAARPSSCRSRWPRASG